MKNKKGTIFIMFFVIILIAVLAGGAYAYFYTDMFKSPKELFFKYLDNNIDRVAELNLQPFDEFSNNAKTTPTEMNFSEKIGVNNKEELKESVSNQFGEDEASKELLLNYIDNGELIFNIKNDPNLGVTEASSQLKAKEELFYLIETYVSQEQLAISYPDLYEKYIGFKNENLKQIFINAGIDDEETLKNIPNELNISRFSPNNASNEKISEVEKKHLNNFISKLPEEHFEKMPNQIVKVDGKDVKANAYKYSVAGEILYKDLTTTVTEFLNDPELQVLLSDAEKEELKTFINKFDNLKKELEAELKEKNFWKSVTMIVYVADGKTINSNFFTGDGANSINFTVTDNSIKAQAFYVDENEVTGETNIEILNTVNNTQGNLKISVNNSYFPAHVDALIKSLEDKIKNGEEDIIINEESKETETEDATLEDGLSVEAEINGDNLDSYTANYELERVKERYKDSEAIITIKSDFTDINNITGNIALSGGSFEDYPLTNIKIILKTDPNIPFTELTESNCEYINKYTEEDYVKLGTQLLINVAKTGEEKPNTLIGTIYQLGKGFISFPTEGTENIDKPKEPTEVENENENNNNNNQQEEVDKEHSEEIRQPNPNIPEDVDFDRISSKVKNAIEYCLLRCQTELSKNPDADVSNYFSIDAINKNLLNTNITVDFIDGENLKVEYKGNEFIATISVDDKYMLNTFKMVKAKDYKPTIQAN